MNRRPLVSILVPVFNRPVQALEAVESVLAQTFQDYELIVVDDGSSTDMRVVSERVEAAGHVYMKIPHQGVSAARNAGLRCVRGEWVCLLDSDDVWYPEKLSRQVAYHRAFPSVLLSQTREDWFRHGKPVTKKKIHVQPEGDIFSRSLELCCISSSSVMLHSRVVAEVGEYDERLLACEDYDMWLRVTGRFRVGLVPETVVAKYGGHVDQLSQKYPAMDRFRCFALWKLLHEPWLSQEQREETRDMLHRKLEILHSGAVRRGRDSSGLYEALLHEVTMNSLESEELWYLLPIPQKN